MILTPDQRLRVFVSSTLQELAAERAAARDAIAGLQLTPVLFELGARPHPPQELYRAYLAQSHLFVGIYGESYGWVAPGESVSGIEDEYQLSAALPRLLYVRADAPEREPALSELLDRIRAEGSASYKPFKTAAELGELLTRDLAVLLTERFQQSPEPAAGPSVPARRLPVPRTSFVGRQEELEEVASLFDAGTRLVTLAGPGGIGKTRLALEAARRSADRYPDGVAFVSLDGLEDAELVPGAIAETLDVREFSGDAVTALVSHLRGREMLLVLDNFEHVVDAAPAVAVLLEEAPKLTVLVTSRELLHLSGEHELQVPPLTPENDGVALFTERATAAAHAFEPAEEDREIVAEICRQLDGVPLAIELAAPRMRLLTPVQLLERLSTRVSLEGPRDAPARQRTLEAAIAWSYELLDEPERRLFERLGAFHASFTIEAAEAAAGEADSRFLDVFSSLLDKSMVYRVPGLGETRFGMLRMIRQFAVERLAERGDLELTRERLTSHYLELARAADEGLHTAAQRQWKRTLDLEADNLRAVLSWAVEDQASADLTTIVRSLMLWFWLHGNLDEGREWAERGLAWPAAPSDRGWLLTIHGIFAALEGEFETAAAELAEAETLLVEDKRGQATVQLTLAFASAPLVGMQEALARLATVLAAFEELGDLWGIGTTLHAMCRLRVVYGDYDGAGDLFERTVAAVERSGDDLGIALGLMNVARERVSAGDHGGAARVIRDCVQRMREGGMTYAGDDVLEILSEVGLAQGESVAAIEILAAADILRERIRTPLWPPAAERHERLVDSLVGVVGQESYDAAYARGTRLDDNELYELAMKLTEPASVTNQPVRATP